MVPTIGGNPLYARISLTSANKLFSRFTHLCAAHAPPTEQNTCIHGSEDLFFVHGCWIGIAEQTAEEELNEALRKIAYGRSRTH